MGMMSIKFSNIQIQIPTLDKLELKPGTTKMKVRG